MNDNQFFNPANFGIKYLLSLLFLLFYLNGNITYSYESKAKAALVFDNSTNTVIYQKNADKPMPPASMSKLMTLNMIFEALKDQRLSLQTQFRTSSTASRKGGSKMFIEEGQLVSVEDLIKGISVVSGNDACIAVAEGLSGTEESFVKEMNYTVKR